MFVKVSSTGDRGEAAGTPPENSRSRCETRRARGQIVVEPGHEQVAHGRAHVAHAQAEAARQLPLQGDVVLIDVRALEVGIDSLAAVILRIHGGRAGAEAVRERAAPDRVSVPELVGRQQVAHTLHGNGRMEQPEAAAQHRPVVLIETPGEADARAEVVSVRMNQRAGQAHVAGQSASD